MEVGIARSYGVCMTMGTASTMTALADALGMTLPGTSSIPAADSNHIRMCSAAGRRIVDMVWEDLTPAKIQTEAAFRNAIVVAMAMGCSTNAVIHLLAMAKRAGHAIGLPDFDAASRIASDRQCQTIGRPISDGRFLLCRRPARHDDAAGTIP